MPRGALRIEFIVVGAAALLVLLVTLALNGVGGDVALLQPLRYLEDAEQTGAGVLILGIYIGAAYVIGIILVQLTYWFPTKFLIERAQRSRLRDLALLESEFVRRRLRPRLGTELLELALKPSEATSLSTKIGQLVGRKKVKRSDLTDRHARSAALTLGRSLANASLDREYEYRRSNRQVCLGLVPSVLGSTYPALITMNELQASTIYKVGFLGTILIIALSLVFTARFQERVAQSLLLDAALWHRWSSSA